MKGFKLSALAAAGIAATFAVAMPVAAQGELTGAGVVTGQVTGLNFPVPPAGIPEALQNFGFSGTGTGAFQQTDGASDDSIGEGGITVSAAGASIAENIAGGVGSVSNVNAGGSGTCIGICNSCVGICSNGSVAVGPLAGVYVRVGVVVVGVLTGSCTVNTVSVYATCAVYFGGLFIPNQVTPPVTSASFDAAFVVVGVKA